MRIHAAILVGLTLSACAAAGRQPVRASANRVPRTQVDIEDRPAWQTEDGRKAAWRELAHWYNDNGLPDEALDMVRRLREAGEDTVELRVIQAESLATQGIPEEALGVLEAVLDTHPRYAPAHEVLGLVYADMGDYERAVPAFQQALQLDDDSPSTRNNLGFLLMGVGRCEEAVQELEQVVTADSSVARYRNNLAFSLVCVGEYERAMKLFRTTNLRESDVRYNMGLAFERIDSVPSAVAQYQQAVSLDPDHERANEALARLTDSPPSDGAIP